MKNFERIDLEQSSAADTITLDLDRVFGMTDDRNRLIIDTNDTTTDTVNFDATGTTGGDTGNDIIIDGETFDEYEYTDGTITVNLLVDQDANFVS